MSNEEDNNEPSEKQSARDDSKDNGHTNRQVNSRRVNSNDALRRIFESSSSSKPGELVMGNTIIVGKTLTSKSDDVNADSEGVSVETFSLQIVALERKIVDLYKLVGNANKMISDAEIKTNKVVAQSRTLSEKNDKSESRIETLTTELNKSKENFRTEVIGFQGEIKDSKNAVLGMIALFASFFSFISVSISVFTKDLDIASSISLVLVLWICLISFLYVFMVALKSGVEFFSSGKMFNHFIVIAVAILFALGVPHLVINKVFKNDVVTEKVKDSAVDNVVKF